MTNDPLVSIVMPAYNAEAFIAESIRSVKQQTYRNWELLIIEDSSHDATAEIIEAFKSEDSRIKMHKLPTNQGAGFARNIGIKASKGEYISFLDADDLWKEDKLQVQIDFMQRNNISVCYSSYELVDEQGRSRNKMITALETLSFKKLLKANYVGNLTGIYSAAKLGKIYCPLIRKRQDWGLWLLALQKAGKAKGILKPLAQYRVRKSSISGNKFEMLQYNFLVYREVLGFSTWKSCYFMLTFLFEQFFIKRKQRVDLN